MTSKDCGANLMTIQMKTTDSTGARLESAPKIFRQTSLQGNPGHPAYSFHRSAVTTHTHTLLLLQSLPGDLKGQPVWTPHNSKRAQPCVQGLFNGSHRPLPLYSLLSSSSGSAFFLPSVISFDLHSLSKQGLGPVLSGPRCGGSLGAR